MNSRFKFRVWNKKHNYYDFCRRKFGILYIQEKFRVSSGYDGEDKPTFCEDVNDNYIIEQCTGLKDKNGNLIYEGDIIKCDRDFSENGRKDLIRKVIFADGSFQLERAKTIGDRYYINAFHNFEILGNIHEINKLWIHYELEQKE